MRRPAHVTASAVTAPSADDDLATGLCDVAFITVQYHNPADTASFIESLRAQSDPRGIEVIVVKNDRILDPPAELAADPVQPAGQVGSYLFPVRVLRAPKNLYYWGGAAFALDELSARGPLPRWVIISNNDVTVEDSEFVRRLRSLDPVRYPIIGPSIISLATGRDQNPILRSRLGKLSEMKWMLYDSGYRMATSLLAVRGLWRSFRENASRRSAGLADSSTAERIYAPHGAFVIFSSEFFDRGGRLDTTVPMFAEELTIAVTAERLEMPVWHLPQLRVSHREHSTTGSRLTRAKYELEKRARRHYFGLKAAQRS